MLSKILNGPGHSMDQVKSKTSTMKRKFTRAVLATLFAFLAMSSSGYSQTTEEKTAPHDCALHNHSHEKTEDGTPQVCKCTEQHDAFYKAHPDALRQEQKEQVVQQQLIQQLKGFIIIII